MREICTSGSEEGPAEATRWVYSPVNPSVFFEKAKPLVPPFEKGGLGGIFL
jgi:hypothetical protein